CPDDPAPIRASRSTRLLLSVAVVRTNTPPNTSGLHATSCAGMFRVAMTFGLVLTEVCEAMNPVSPSQLSSSHTVHGPRHPGYGVGVHFDVVGFHSGTALFTGGVVSS